MGLTYHIMTMASGHPEHLFHNLVLAMKKICLSLCCILVVLLSACSKDYKEDPFASYRQQTASEIFHRAEQALREEQYDYAAGELEALDGVYPFGPYAQRGQLDIIYAYYKSGDASSAVAAAERYIHLYPRGEHADYAHYMRGLASFNVGMSRLQRKLHVKLADRDVKNLQQAYVAFRSVLVQYPKSRYATGARYYLIKIRNMMAEHEYRVARYYWQHKAYIAAINRATFVVQHFEGTIWVPPALVLMKKAYVAAQLPGEAQRVAALLQKNYPEAAHKAI